MPVYQAQNAGRMLTRPLSSNASAHFAAGEGGSVEGSGQLQTSVWGTHIVSFCGMDHGGP